MRIRATVAAAACAVGIALSFPIQAHAVEGLLGYWTYQGEASVGFVPNDTCIPLPEVANPSVPPAMYPFNDSDTSAVIYANADCTGAHLQITPHTGGQAGNFGFRSVIFTNGTAGRP